MSVVVVLACACALLVKELKVEAWGNISLAHSWGRIPFPFQLYDTNGNSYGRGIILVPTWSKEGNKETTWYFCATQVNYLNVPEKLRQQGMRALVDPCWGRCSISEDHSGEVTIQLDAYRRMADDSTVLIGRRKDARIEGRWLYATISDYTMGTFVAEYDGPVAGYRGEASAGGDLREPQRNE